MSSPSIILPEERQSAPVVRESPDRAWHLLGWLGLLLAVVGAADIALVWYPARWGSPEWEFGAVDYSFSGLPLLTMGMAGLLASAVARGRVWLVRAVSGSLILLALVILAAYAVFLTVVPIALQTAPAEVVVGIQKAIVKTSVFGVVFSVTYLLAAISSLRMVRRRNRGGRYA